MRKLQISLPDFRRLCIFKGIYPREPTNKRKVSKSATPATTFYYTKDIQYLLHEPLLNKFREHKALAKKIAKSLGRGEVGDAARLEKNHGQKITLDRIIRERYPTFTDAVRDLDDALSLIFLFANLPSTEIVPAKTIALCRRLSLEFEHYVITTHCLRKSFLSIKGIYYQATIHGQDVMWIVPYKFVQRMTNDVDFRIMGTFVEFYTTLLGFVNFRLYTTIGLIYPPKLNVKSDERGGELDAITLQEKDLGPEEAITNGTATEQSNADITMSNGDSTEAPANADIQKQVDAILSEPPPPEEGPSAPEPLDQESVPDPTTIDTFSSTDPNADILPQPQPSASTAAALFAPFTVYLSRETPRQSLEFLLRAFGCNRVGWDAVLGDGAFVGNEADSRITHQIVDRPPVNPDEMDARQGDDEGLSRPQTFAQGMRVPGRIYVQPQWVWDCVNEGKLLRPDTYAPGETLPPHLSPWVKPKEGQYDPTVPVDQEGLEDDEVEDEVVAPDMLEDEIASGSYQELKNVGAEGDMNVANDDDDGVDEDASAAGSDFGGLSDTSAPNVEDTPTSAPEIFEEIEESPEERYQREIAAEASGLSINSSTVSRKSPKATRSSDSANPDLDKRRREARRQKQEAAEELERRKMMMSRKKRKMVEKMMYGNRKREDEAEKLRSKKRRLERAKGRPTV